MKSSEFIREIKRRKLKKSLLKAMMMLSGLCEHISWFTNVIWKVC